MTGCRPSRLCSMCKKNILFLMSCRIRSGIQENKGLKKYWIPGQARNDEGVCLSTYYEINTINVNNLFYGSLHQLCNMLEFLSQLINVIHGMIYLSKDLSQRCRFFHADSTRPSGMRFIKGFGIC